MLKTTLDRQNRWMLKPAAIALLLFGAAILVVWYITNNGSMMSMLLLLAGVSVVCLSLMLYFFSPSLYLRSEVAEAMSVSGVKGLRDILGSLLIESKGVYIPASQSGSTRLFIPLSEKQGPEEISTIEPKGSAVFSVLGSGTKGILISPTGNGLYTYTKSIGAFYTDEGIENEIKDIIENSLEMAKDVSVKREEDTIKVNMKGLAIWGMCTGIRKEDPKLCYQIGCPICSLLGCMIVDATGRKARIEDIKAGKDSIEVTFRLI